MIASLSKGSEDADKSSLDMWWHSLKPQTLQKVILELAIRQLFHFLPTGGWASHLLAEGHHLLLNKQEAKRISEADASSGLEEEGEKIFRYVLIVIRSRRICIAFASRDRIAYVVLSPKGGHHCRVGWLSILHYNTVELNNNKHLLTF
ncbi:hypothetical protein TNCV_1567381 [Trichonephila clavipes]|nr:hypothetical protein TNCV_1567381 [Trichonephila clavipes]